MIDTRFFVRIRGAFTPPPTIEDPVVNIPVAAPTTDNEMDKPTPNDAHMYGVTPVMLNDETIIIFTITIYLKRSNLQEARQRHQPDDHVQ